LGLALLLAIGGLLGSRVVVAQQLEKVGNPALRRMEYKVTDSIYLNQMDRPLREMAAEGWELVQVVPTVWTAGGQGQHGDFHKGIIVARRPMVPGK
jgi:hypothetical protein